MIKAYSKDYSGKAIQNRVSNHGSEFLGFELLE